MADGPLTNLGNLPVSIDSTQNLVVYAKVQSGSDSPAMTALNTRGRVETGSQLVVTFR